MQKYVLDTNVLISNPQSVFSFNSENTEIIITQSTLEEIDHLKNKDGVGREARVVIRMLADILLQEDYNTIIGVGVQLSKFNSSLPDTVRLRIVQYKGPEIFELNQQDAKIIAIAKQESATLVTGDVNMMLIAMSEGVNVKRYSRDGGLRDEDVTFDGCGYVSDDFWDTIGPTLTYEGKDVAVICIEDFPVSFKTFYPGTFVISKDSDGNEKIIGKIKKVSGSDVYMKVLSHKQLMNRKIWGITARDTLQASFIDGIFDDDMDVVTCMAGAGSGKTLLAIAAGLELVVEKKKFDKIIYCKADMLGVDAHGYLPGTLEDKLSESIKPALDSLEYLVKDHENPQGSIEFLIDKGIIKFESMAYFRGRSFANTLIILDEVQSNTNLEVTTALSRIGEGSKIILLGNTKQIDNRQLSALNNGLVYAVNNLKTYEHSSHVLLKNIYRSRLAEFIEENFN